MPRYFQGATALKSRESDKSLASLDVQKAIQNRGHQRLQILQCIAPRDHYDHCNVKGGQILLALEVPIDREEHLEFAFGETQELAISLTGPAHLRCRSHVILSCVPAVSHYYSDSGAKARLTLCDASMCLAGGTWV